jgi:hypothetical protein
LKKGVYYASNIDSPKYSSRQKEAYLPTHLRNDNPEGLSFQPQITKFDRKKIFGDEKPQIKK